MAYTIVRFCLFVPKFTYVLRCSHLWKFRKQLDKIDNVIRETLVRILNCPIDDKAWNQASLPVRFGGIGIRKSSSIALPAFLSSVHASIPLCNSILSPSLGSVEICGVPEGVEQWRSITSECLPEHPNLQRQWDEPMCKGTQLSLINACNNAVDRARLLALAEKESGYWLQALPSANIGTLLDNYTFSLSVGLRLGSSINRPHRCVCGVSVSEQGHHGLSCARSAGRIPRHATLNDVIKRALATAGVPSILEPNGIIRADGKRPDGMTLVPWKSGRCLVWDATCVDTLAPSHIPSTSIRAAAAARAAEASKKRKYLDLGGSYLFLPFAVETMGPWGPDAKDFLKEISSRLIEATGDPRAGSYFAQRVSLAVQRGNAASILGTLPRCGALEEIFYI
ncbi:hypothetical protein NE865_04007 [Phthorimaea operculella]|nr:hypothetical protein NE865_04007 [Phthorimaea operculella]